MAMKVTFSKMEVSRSGGYNTVRGGHVYASATKRVWVQVEGKNAFQLHNYSGGKRGTGTWELYLFQIKAAGIELPEQAIRELKALNGETNLNIVKKGIRKVFENIENNEVEKFEKNEIEKAFGVVKAIRLSILALHKEEAKAAKIHGNSLNPTGKDIDEGVIEGFRNSANALQELLDEAMAKHAELVEKIKV